MNTLARTLGLALLSAVISAGPAFAQNADDVAEMKELRRLIVQIAALVTTPPADHLARFSARKAWVRLAYRLEAINARLYPGAPITVDAAAPDSVVKQADDLLAKMSH